MNRATAAAAPTVGRVHGWALHEAEQALHNFLHELERTRLDLGLGRWYPERALDAVLARITECDGQDCPAARAVREDLEEEAHTSDVLTRRLGKVWDQLAQERARRFGLARELLLTAGAGPVGKPTALTLALRRHQLGWLEGRQACVGCGWMPLDGSLIDFAEHQGEVALQAVLEGVDRLHAQAQTAGPDDVPGDGPSAGGGGGGRG